VPGVHRDITRRSYVVVDVFTETPLEGNPLAVVTDGDGLSEKLMQRIAREFNQSETTYLLSPSSSRAHAALRSFTASGDEVFGAGHNSLGAWWWLIASGRFELDDGHTELTQELGGSRLPVLVVRERGRLTAVGLRQTAPQFGAEIEDGDELAGALGLSARDLSPECAQVVFTGAPHLIVAARDRAAVERAVPDAARLAAALRSVGGQGCYLYCLDPIAPQATAYARFFNPTVGISEDPATGSAAGPLACQLVRRGQADEGTEIAIEQGHAIGRPSRIIVRIQGQAVTVFGACVEVARGVLTLDRRHASRSRRNQGVVES
jgi:trans-2,3-dihydro-3-hydroxyanthranilate isomerase